MIMDCGCVHAVNMYNTHEVSVSMQFHVHACTGIQLDLDYPDFSIIQTCFSGAVVFMNFNKMTD